MNNERVWQQLPISKDRRATSFFPLAYPHTKVQVRHAGDPLLAALNLTEERGSLDFGVESRKQLAAGITGLVITLIVIACTLLRCSGALRGYARFLFESTEGGGWRYVRERRGQRSEDYMADEDSEG